jgi:hypothetical protein
MSKITKNPRLSGDFFGIDRYWPAAAPAEALLLPPAPVPAARTWIDCAVKLPSELVVPPIITFVPTVSLLTETIVGSDTGVELE